MDKKFTVGQMVNTPNMDGLIVSNIETGSDGQARILATHDGCRVSRDTWCECGCKDSVYYEEIETGTHGWACRACRRIKQVG